MRTTGRSQLLLEARNTSLVIRLQKECMLLIQNEICPNFQRTSACSSLSTCNANGDSFKVVKHSKNKKNADFQDGVGN